MSQLWGLTKLSLGEGDGQDEKEADKAEHGSLVLPKERLNTVSPML